jgi:hypothetical protein
LAAPNTVSPVASITPLFVCEVNATASDVATTVRKFAVTDAATAGTVNDVVATFGVASTPAVVVQFTNS